MGTESAWGAVSRCTITAEQPALNENTFVKAVSAESGRPFFTDAVKATEITSQASHSAPVQRPVRPATPADRSPEGSGGIHRTGERQAACFSINAPRSSPRLRSVRTACGSFPAGVFRREFSGGRRHGLRRRGSFRNHSDAHRKFAAMAGIRNERRPVGRPLVHYEAVGEPAAGRSPKRNHSPTENL